MAKVSVSPAPPKASPAFLAVSGVRLPFDIHHQISVQCMI